MTLCRVKCMINCNQHIVHACIDYAAILNAVYVIDVIEVHCKNVH